MKTGAEFAEFLFESSYSGKIGLVVKFSCKADKAGEFNTVFNPVCEKSYKEKGCIKVCKKSDLLNHCVSIFKI